MNNKQSGMVEMNLQAFAAAGKAAVIKVAAATIQGLNDAKITINGETIDTTDFASSGWLKKILGLKSAEGSVAGFFDAADTTGQTVLRAALLSGTAQTMTFLPDGTNGYTGSFLVTKLELGATVAGEVSVAFSFESTGAITASP